MSFDLTTYESNEVYRSWVDHPFIFVDENSSKTKEGLRKPQLAAIYRTLSHLIASPLSPATIVMPTGTGKTDTICSLIISGLFARTLIVVPSDSLREQTEEKVGRLKTLYNIKAISEKARPPITAKINERLSKDKISSLTNYNVIIATPQALNNFDDEELQELEKICSHLVVDEAHHVAAATWTKIRNLFKSKPCLQFTATPFREDRASLAGEIIYNYSLKDAQQDGYFQEIEFHPIREYLPDMADIAISEKAVQLLKKDHEKYPNHILLVRARFKNKAEKLLKIYEKYEELSPVLIHSEIKGKSKILKDIKAKKHKIIICVDMLGEGFDLPELKIAAIHDQHCSTAVTLQFIGRLTRASKDLGTAKFVANIANQKIDAQMSILYEESADWSAIIRDMSENKIKREIDREEFFSEFSDEDDGKKIIALNPLPNISATAYKVLKEDWTPTKVEQFRLKNEELKLHTYNENLNLVIAVTKSKENVPWANTAEIQNTNWHLYLAYYIEDEKTLFIHSTGDEFQTKHFINLITTSQKKIWGPQTFRTLHNIEYIQLQNVGLSRTFKDLRFTMHVGRDINEVIGELEDGTSIKSNIFAVGHENGIKVTAGCSHKGKLWEMNSATIDHWIKWCKKTSLKINNENIDSKEIIKNVMISQQLNEWPTGIFYADWPDKISIDNEAKISLNYLGESYSLLELSLGQPVLKSPTKLEIPLAIETQNDSQELLFNISIELTKDEYRYSCPEVGISIKNQPLSTYLNDNPLRLLKTDGSFLFGNYRYFSDSTLNRKIPRELLVPWDWENTSIHKESMGKDCNLDTVQGYTFKKIKDSYEIIFNDDGSGEIADLIGIKTSENQITVDFYHCKFCPSKKGKPLTGGGRVTDTYEVSGQTSRSVKWLNRGEQLFSRLIKRYTDSKQKGFDRLLKGQISEIDILRRKTRDLELKIGFYLVQPAIYINSITDEQLTVLGTSYTYIKNISGTNLKAIINKK